MTTTTTNMKGVLLSAAQIKMVGEGGEVEYRERMRPQPTITQTRRKQHRRTWHTEIAWKGGRSRLHGFSGLEDGDKQQLEIWAEDNSPLKPGDVVYAKEEYYVDHSNYVDGRLPAERPADVDDDMIYCPADATGKGSWCCQLIPECCCCEVGRPRIRKAGGMPSWAARYFLRVSSVTVEKSDKGWEWVNKLKRVEKPGKDC